MKKVTLEIMNAYDTRVRHAISDEYVRVAKEKRKLIDEMIEVEEKLNNPDTKMQMPYAKYVELEKKEKELEAAMNKLKIEREVWDQAREICMNIADEMFG